VAKASRTKMPVSQRAKQFAPFQSLKGFEEALIKKENAVLQSYFPNKMPENVCFPFPEIMLNSTISIVVSDNGDSIVHTGTVTALDIINRTITLDNRIFSTNNIISINF
jgi:hypothetical protein